MSWRDGKTKTGARTVAQEGDEVRGTGRPRSREALQALGRCSESIWKWGLGDLLTLLKDASGCGRGHWRTREEAGARRGRRPAGRPGEGRWASSDRMCGPYDTCSGAQAGKVAHE